jgi:hypothetical protein
MTHRKWEVVNRTTGAKGSQPNLVPLQLGILLVYFYGTSKSSFLFFFCYSTLYKKTIKEKKSQT